MSTPDSTVHPAQWEVVDARPRRAGAKARADGKAPPPEPSVEDIDIEATAERCRALVKRRALVAAGVAMVPLPGLDWATDIGILVKLLPEINRAFGLTEAQVERLAPDRRLVVYKAISAGGGMLVGKVVTRELVMLMLRLVGVRLTTQQAAKFVPIAGQAVSAALTWSALRFVCEQHIRQCMAVARQLQLPAPAPAPAATADAAEAPGTPTAPGAPAAPGASPRG